MTLAALGLGYLAGLLSVLSPCVLPLLPIVLTGASAQGRWGPVALASGLGLSFAGMGLFLATLGFAWDIDEQIARRLAAALMALFGLVMLLPSWQARLAGWLAGPGASLQTHLARISPDGSGGQFLLGLLLGLAWSPCAGPALGAAVGVAGQSRNLMGAGAVMALFGIGAATPLLAVAQGLRRSGLITLARIGRPLLGGALLLVAILVGFDLDKLVESWTVGIMPAWLIDLTTRF